MGEDADVVGRDVDGIDDGRPDDILLMEFSGDDGVDVGRLGDAGGDKLSKGDTPDALVSTSCWLKYVPSLPDTPLLRSVEPAGIPCSATVSVRREAEDA